jgi:hypothetical protein
MSFPHPTGALHARLKSAGFTDKQLNREFICDLIGIRGRDSLTKLTLEQIAFAKEQLKQLSNEQIAECFAAWRNTRAREQYSINELLQLEEEFKREHPDAEALGMTLADYLETRGAA